MSLKAQLTDDMKTAMKAGEKDRLGVIRLVLAAIKQKEVDERIEMTDPLVLAVLDKMVKQRKDSITQYEAAAREDLAQVERYELGVIQTYLPAQMAAEEVEAIVVAAIEPTAAASVPPGAPGSADFLRVEGDRVIVEAGETLGHFADWLQVTPQHLMRLNKLKPRRPIQVGQSLRLDFAKVTPDVFQQLRLEYHKGIEEDFFGSFRVANTLEHKLKPGETLWLLSHKKYAVPGWLIRRYNPDVDLGKLVPGVVLVIPIVEKIG